METRSEFDEAELPEIQEQTESDEPPRGWQPSAETVESIGGENKPPTGFQDAQIVGDANDIQKIQAGLDRLESTEQGKAIAQTIRERDTSLGFGKTDDGAIAEFDPNANSITINESQKDASQNVIAAHLAHEGTHAGWDEPTRIDKFENFSDDYIEQEYQAHKAQAEVWGAAKGEGETDRQCDSVANMIDKGEAEAKAELQQSYRTEIRESWRLKNQ